MQVEELLLSELDAEKIEKNLCEKIQRKSGGGSR